MLCCLFHSAKKASLFFIVILSLINVFIVSSGYTNKRKVSLFFDDGWANQYDVAFPILKEYGFKASFGIIVDYIGLDRGTFWSRMNIGELNELKDYGMEIASYSKSHAHLSNLTDEKLRAEIFGSKDVLASFGFNAKTFVYPYGEWNFTVMDYVKEAGYVCARTVSPEVYFLGTTYMQRNRIFLLGRNILSQEMTKPQKWMRSGPIGDDIYSELCPF